MMIMMCMMYSWEVYDWDIFGSFKSFSQTAFIVVIFEIAEMNAFFLKSCLWIPPSVSFLFSFIIVASFGGYKIMYLGFPFLTSCTRGL